MSLPPRSLMVARRKLAKPLDIARMAFTPDGKTLVIEQQGKTKVRLAFTVPDLRPVAAPSGDEACGFTRASVRHLLAVGKRPSMRHLVVPSAPGASTLLTFRLLGGYISEKADISPDHRLAAAICEIDALEERCQGLWVVRLPDGAPRAALPIKGRTQLQELAVAPDGVHVAAANLEEVILLDAEAVMRGERQHEEAFARLRKWTLAELKAVTVRGLTLRDFYFLYGAPRKGICVLKTPLSEMLSGFQGFEEASRGRGAPRPPRFQRKEGRLWPDILTAMTGVQIVSSRAVAAFEKHGLSGWRVHPVTIEDREVPFPYFGIEVLAEPLRSLREIEYADPAEHSVNVQAFDLSDWQGEDFVRLSGNGGLYGTRRVLKAFEEESLRGWMARDLLQEGRYIEGPPPLTAEPTERIKHVRPSQTTRIVPSCWDAGKVARLLGEAGLQRVREAAIRAMRPAWGILTRPAGLDELPSGGSHLGGSPDLPAGTAWPAGANGPLYFLGQLRVEDLSALDAEHLLPGSGLLSFFLDPESGEESAAKVLFTAPGARLERLAPLPELESRAYLPCALELRAFPSLPDVTSSEVEGWKLSAKEADAYGDLRWDLLEAHGIGSDRMHQVFGYPCSIDHDVFREAADEGARWTAGESRLLLQIDEDDQLGTEWGDCGRIFLVLPAPALRELRLDRVVYIFQCG